MKKLVNKKRVRISILFCIAIIFVAVIDTSDAYAYYDYELGECVDGHNWSDWDFVDDDYYWQCGKYAKEYRECYDCDVIEYRETHYVDHDWLDWEITKKATPFIEGKKYRECYTCEKKQYEVIPRIKKTSLPVKNTIISEKTKSLKPGESITIDFGTDHKITLNLPFEITTKSKISSGSFQGILKNGNNKVIENDKYSLKGLAKGYYEWDYYYTAKLLPKGNYKYTLKNTTDKTISVKYSLLAYTKFSTKATIKKSMSAKRSQWVEIGKFDTGNYYIKGIKSSNKKIVDNNYYYVDKNGKINVYVKNKGTTKLTVTINNGKKYNITIKGIAAEMDVMAYLCEYNTRDNYFTVKIKNCGIYSVYVVRSGGKVEDKDYKTWDRKLKKQSTVKIKPGQTKYVKFSVSGSTTWPDYKDFTLFSKLKYDGATYEWHVWDCDSSYKRGGKWWSTYSDQDKYDNWA